MKDIPRTAIAAVLAVFVGILTLPFMFSDVGPDETVALRVTVVGGIFFLGGALVGWMAGRLWPVSALCAWTAFGMGIVMLVSKLTLQGQMPYWSAIGGFLLVPLAVSVLGGYAGHRIGRRIGRQ